MLYLLLFYVAYVAPVVNWAIIIGTPIAYIALIVYIGRRIKGKSGAAYSILLIGIPVAWIAAMYVEFSTACDGSKQVYLKRVEGVDGVFAKGPWARYALNDDVLSEDGYLFYEFEEGGTLYRVDPSGKREQVQRRRSRFEFEVFAPKVRNAAFSISESRYEVRDTENATVVAEGVDVVLGGFPFKRFYRTQYGNEFVGCVAGLSGGGWRGGKDFERTGGPNNIADEQSLSSWTVYAKRDREFLRTALIPSRSEASMSFTLDATARLESAMSFSNTLWKLLKEIELSGRYGEPTLYFRGDVPVAQLHPATAAQVRSRAQQNGGEKTKPGDPDMATARYWVNVLYSKKRYDLNGDIPHISVIQGPSAVVVKAVPLRNDDEVFGTVTLNYRRGLVDDMSRLVRLAVQTPEKQSVPSQSEVQSPFGYDETIERVLGSLEASPAYFVHRKEPLNTALHSGSRATMVRFSKQDGQLMRRVFSYDSLARGPVPLNLKVIDRNGTIVVDYASLAEAFPEGLLSEFVAVYVAEVQHIVEQALDAS